MGKTIDIGGRLHSTEQGNVVAGANEIYDDTKGKKQNVINGEVDAALEGLDQNKQDNLTFDQTPTESSTNPVTSGGVYAADAVIQQAIDAILTLIPSAASALNQLADKQFVNSSIATSTATFRGTYNLVSDLHLSVTASHADIATALATVVSSADNQDYAFVQVPTSDTSSDIRVTERYKFNGEVWMYEYDLNNSGFTAQQWEAINSTITLALVQKLGALPTTAELATLLLGKQNVLTFDNVPTSGSDNPVKSGGLYEKFTAIDAKMPSDASADNKLVAENRLAAYVGTIIEALDASFNLTSADGHVTFRLTQADGQITSVQIATDDIASASQVSTNTTDIANLQAAYAGLTQSDIIVGTLPSSGQQQNVIYRQPDPDHTPPQFYSDYMWNGSTWVIMATYNNAIDPRPKKGSQNLVTSGGVFDNMGALDVSELNATENPHTLATYADLSAALAAIPSDYQKGGMSIKFLQSSAHKYVQYRLRNQTFSTNIDEWEVLPNIIEVDASDFVYIRTDSDGKMIEAIKADGTKIIFGDIQINGDILNKDKTSLYLLISSKMNRINPETNVNNEEILSFMEPIEDSEWLKIITDNEGKLLKGITKDGKYIVLIDSVFHKIKVNDGIDLSEKAKLKLQEEIGTQNYKLYYYDSILCAGDSLTAGIVTEGTIEHPDTLSGLVASKSYPSILGRMLPKAEITTKAVGGITAIDWLANIYPTVDFSDYELMIFELGMNGGLSLSDINTSGTNTYAYRQIIAGARAQNPTAVIAITRSASFYTENWLPVLEYIADESGCIILDLESDEAKNIIDLDDIELHGYYDDNGTPAVDWVHFTRKGYTCKAHVISVLLEEKLTNSTNYSNI